MSAFGDVFFTAKTQTAIAAFACVYLNCCFVDEFLGGSLQLPVGLCHGGKRMVLYGAHYYQWGYYKQPQPQVIKGVG